MNWTYPKFIWNELRWQSPVLLGIFLAYWQHLCKSNCCDCIENVWLSLALLLFVIAVQRKIYKQFPMHKYEIFCARYRCKRNCLGAHLEWKSCLFYVRSIRKQQRNDMLVTVGTRSTKVAMRPRSTQTKFQWAVDYQNDSGMKLPHASLVSSSTTYSIEWTSPYITADYQSDIAFVPWYFVFCDIRWVLDYFE